MELEERATDVLPPLDAASGWQATLLLGVVTLILGLIVSFHPSGSLSVIAVLLGVLLIISGLFHLVRVFGRNVQGMAALIASFAGDSREGRGWWIFFGIVA